MPALDYPPPLQRLIAQIKSLPGLGPRSAERLVLWLMQDGGRVEPLVDALRAVTAAVLRWVPSGDAMQKTRRAKKYRMNE